MRKKKEHTIQKVLPGSIGEEAGLESGDVLLAVDGQPVFDVFDYRFLIHEESLELSIRKKDGQEWLLEIEKEYDEDLGLEFENGLMSEYRSCANRCIFCFIDQMPPGMRKTLYFKDDDSRLSFLQGNYITLTNMKQQDIDRIVHLQMSPVNISIHTTNRELRCKMLGNRFAGESLRYLEDLYLANVEMNGQIVLCKGVNDGAELRKSIADLSRYLPVMRSLSVVPAGLTKYRENLYPLEMFTKEEAEAVIDLVEAYQKQFFSAYGLHFVHASDEWYIQAGRDFPEAERYDNYVQLENGVGMMRLFIEEFEAAFQKLPANPPSGQVSIATGKLAYPTIFSFAKRLMEKVAHLKIQVFCIENQFFGETITVSGLITGQDLIRQLAAWKKQGGCLGERLLIPINMLRSGEQVFLDDVTTKEVEQALGLPVVPVENRGEDFVRSILDPTYETKRNNENFVYTSEGR